MVFRKHTDILLDVKESDYCNVSIALIYISNLFISAISYIVRSNYGILGLTNDRIVSSLTGLVLSTYGNIMCISKESKKNRISVLYHWAPYEKTHMSKMMEKSIFLTTINSLCFQKMFSMIYVQ